MMMAGKLTAGLAVVCALLSMGVKAAPADDYAIGAGDLLQITVSGYPELAVSERVSENGTITFPYLEPLKVARQSSSGVIDLLAQAGGPIVSESGNPNAGVAGDEATLTRRDGKVIKIDLGALFAGDSRQNVPVAGGDTIFVPRAPQFYVYGEVQKAGVYQLQHHMTVAQAISAGGGLTQRGSQRRIVLKRKDDQGREYETSIKTSEILQPDDVLYVKESLF
jgi:polysaccharide export outer membrane protein